MLNCPFNNSCIKSSCDYSCSEFSEIIHWMNRCDLTIANPSVRASRDQILSAEKIIQQAVKDTDLDSSYMHISVYCGGKSQFFADLTTYVCICKYCRNIGFYNGTYKLNFSSYLEEIKKSWNSRNNSDSLEDIKLWINSARYLIITNLGLVRFGDFESQTLLSIFQDRYDQNKYTMLFLEKEKFILPGKQDSVFYAKLKNEISIRGVRV